MITLFCIFLFLWGCAQTCSAHEYEHSEYECERRHREMLEERKRHNEIMEKKKPDAPKKKIKRTRRILRDEKGRFIAAEEIIEEID